MERGPVDALIVDLALLGFLGCAIGVAGGLLVAGGAAYATFKTGQLGWRGTRASVQLARRGTSSVMRAMAPVLPVVGGEVADLVWPPPTQS